MKKTIIFGLMFLLMVFSVNAVQPTQQYYKSYIDPFYRVSMAVNTNYTYNLVVNPPDGISSVTSAIINFNGQINGQTQTFTLWVNGQSCNNPTYSVATAFSTTGNVQFAFDCSNRITQPGNYTITLRSAVATGAMQGWLDLTYMNSPAGALQLHGTEYIPGDIGKMFLQFLDSSNQAVTNSECFLSVWYPNDTILLNNSLMSKLQNASDGIYYKNFNVPSATGVYPASAKCYKPLSFNYVALPTFAYDTFETGTYLGGTGWANDTGALPNYGWDIEDTQPLSTIITNASASGPCYNGTYCAKYTGSYGFIERGVRIPEGATAINITWATKFKGFQTGETCELWLFDGNWHLLQSINLAGGFSNNVWYTRSQYLSGTEYEIAGSAILIGFYLSSAPSTGDECYIDNVNVAVIAPNITISNITQYEILRGSGEVHVSNLYGQINASLLTPQQISASVWNFTTRNLTYYQDVTNYTQIGLSVWTNTFRNLTYFDYVMQGQYIWNSTNRNLTYYPDLTNYTKIADFTWNYTARYTHGVVLS